MFHSSILLMKCVYKDSVEFSLPLVEILLAFPRFLALVHGDDEIGGLFLKTTRLLLDRQKRRAKLLFLLRNLLRDLEAGTSRKMNNEREGGGLNNHGKRCKREKVILGNSDTDRKWFSSIADLFCASR